MADMVFNDFLEKLNIKLLDLKNDDIKCVLLTSSYTPDRNHEFYSNVSSYEVTGAGYTVGGESLTNKTVLNNAVTNIAWFDSDNVSWPSSTITARYAVLYDNTRTEKDLITLYDFVTDKSSTDGTFEVIPDATDGWYKITQV